MSVSLAAAFDEACRRFESRVALVEDGRILTYREVGLAVASLARAYRRLGLVPGDRVACRLPNCSELIIAAAAAWRSRLIYVGLPKDLSDAETGHAVDQTFASAIVEPSAASARLSGSPGNRRTRSRVVVTRARADLGPHDFEELLCMSNGDRRPRASELGEVLEEDAAVMFLTSGTTGRPKVVLHRHRPLVKSWLRYATLMQVSQGDVHLGHLPQSHAFGLATAMACLLTGGRLVLLERFSPEAALAMIADHGVVVLSGAPTHFRLILDHLDPSRHDVSRLRVGIASAGPFERELLGEIFDRLRMQLVMVYGSTEGFGCRTTDRDAMLQGSVGTPAPGSVAILDDAAHELPAGVAGEVAFRRRNRRPPEWPSGRQGEWHRTGDLGKLDGQGQLYLLGRRDHQINRGGEKVNPEEVEEVLLTHPQIADCVVVPRPDPVLGEAVAVVVVAASDPPPTLDDICAFTAGRVARYKLPEHLRVAASIRRTALGKVNRRALGATFGDQR